MSEQEIMAKKEEKKEKTRVRLRYKHRVPHKPTRVHRDRTKYTRKGKVKRVVEKQLHEDES
jgi:hypothetical protein